MKTLKKLSLTLAISSTLIGCAGSQTQGALTVDYISGAFEPTIALATMKNPKTGEVTQQFFTDAGIASRLLQGAVQVGASYATYGLYRPNNQNNTSISANKTSNTTSSTRTSVVPTNSGTAGSPTAIYNNLSASANPTIQGSTAVGGQGGVAQGGETVNLNNVSPTTTGGDLSFSDNSSKEVNVSPTNVVMPNIEANPVNNNTPVISPTNTVTFPTNNGSGTINENAGGNGNCNGGNCGIGQGNGGGNGTGNEGNNRGEQ